jgi:hypothetical protein
VNVRSADDAGVSADKCDSHGGKPKFVIRLDFGAVFR